jgi:REP element-mobilizing transposase RayT
VTRKPETIDFWVGRLPHWEVVDGRYFVTIHLSGAIPEAGHFRIRKLSAELESLKTDDERLRTQRLIFAEMEAWLDRAERVIYLSNPAIAEMVCEAIEHRQRQSLWNVFEYVVMPNHIHLFFELVTGRLKSTLEDFKEWTGRKAGTFVRLDGQRFWQKEWFDHWSRSGEEDERIVAYIRRNPIKAGLVKEFEQWPHASWSRSLVGSAGPAEPGRANRCQPANPGPAGPAGPTVGPAGPT